MKPRSSALPVNRIDLPADRDRHHLVRKPAGRAMQSQKRTTIGGRAASEDGGGRGKARGGRRRSRGGRGAAQYNADRPARRRPIRGVALPQVLLALLAPKFIVVSVSRRLRAVRPPARARPAHVRAPAQGSLDADGAVHRLMSYLLRGFRPSPSSDVRRLPELADSRELAADPRGGATLSHQPGRHPAATGHNDLGFNSFFKEGWKRFYLTWYGHDGLPSAQALSPKNRRAARVAAEGEQGDVRAAAAGRKARPAIAIVRRLTALPPRLVCPDSDGLPGTFVDEPSLVLARRRMCSSTNVHPLRREQDRRHAHHPVLPTPRAASRADALDGTRSSTAGCRAASSAPPRRRTEVVENEQVGAFNRIYAFFGRGSDLLRD